jgi:hypothetical protein
MEYINTLLEKLDVESKKARHPSRKKNAGVPYGNPANEVNHNDFLQAKKALIEHFKGLFFIATWN